MNDTTIFKTSIENAAREIDQNWSAGDTNDDYSDWVYSHKPKGEGDTHKQVDSYVFPVSHDATVARFDATENHDDAETSISPKDADGDDTNGHQVNLGRGNNEVTVTVTNGDVSATHVINLVRPGLLAKEISVTEDRGTKADAPYTVKLDPAFDRNKFIYSATVESWVQDAAHQGDRC